MCFLQDLSAAASQVTGFAGPSLVSPLQCAVSFSARKALGQGGLLLQKQSPNQEKRPSKGGSNHQAGRHLYVDCSASKDLEEAFFWTLFREVTRQLHLILSCFNAKHDSKISISFVLTEEIDWNFQSVRCKADSYY